MTAPKGYTNVQTPNFTPEQMQLFQNFMRTLNSSGGLQSGMEHLSNLASGDEKTFQQIEAPAYQALEQGLAQSANRFSGVGAQDSSAFQNNLSGQSSQMAQNLAGQRNQIQQDAISKLMGFSSNILGQKPYENMLQKDDSFDMESMAKMIIPLIAAYISKNPAALAAM